jgi:ABC-type Fe3+-hydroxamate transport system substrate-binding protein
MKITDSLDRIVQLTIVPKTVVSLVPSITELLIDMGIDVIGRTKYCIHPAEKVGSIEIVGGTKDIDVDKIIKLAPDLIIAVKEENDQHQIESLYSKIPTIVFDITSVKSALQMIDKLGMIFNAKETSELIVSNIENGIHQLNKRTSESVAYLIWQNPMMTINRNTFISDMLELAGFRNVFADNTKEYQEITEIDIKSLNPNFIFLSTEPYPFKGKHVNQYQKQFNLSKIVLVDGELFSWYGSRMLKAIDYFLQNKYFE